MVKPHKKGLLLVSPIPHNREWTNDETFEFFNVLHSLEYEGAWEKIWDLMSLIFNIRDWAGLGIPEQSRRHFVVCLCMGQPFGCCDKKAKKVMEDLLNLELNDVGAQFSFEDYKGTTEKHVEWTKNRNRLLGVYQKAKLLLIRPNWWKGDIPYFVPDESVEAAKLAFEFFPNNDKESLTDTLNKRNIFIYEYLFHQPITDDYDFNPCSPFYGLPLEERLEILPKSIGTDSELYTQPYLRQEQWKGVFNCEGTDYLDHSYYVKKTYSVRHKKNGRRRF